MPNMTNKDSSHSPEKAKPKAQREALQKILGQLYGEVEKEKSFEWLVVTDPRSMQCGTLSIIYNALREMRGYSDFFKVGRRLKYDFHVPTLSLVIEYDERQHFTVQRAKALEHYPPSLRLGFDKNEWIQTCRRIQAKDPVPVYRDEQRAFYDSMRDLEAVAHQTTIIRIQHGAQDWTGPGAPVALERILEAL